MLCKKYDDAPCYYQWFSKYLAPWKPYFDSCLCTKLDDFQQTLHLTHTALLVQFHNLDAVIVQTYNDGIKKLSKIVQLFLYKAEATGPYSRMYDE